MEVLDDDHLLVITASGKIIRMTVDGISRIGRATQGVRVIQLSDDDVVSSAIRTAEDEEPMAPATDGVVDAAADGSAEPPDASPDAGGETPEEPSD
jgi:DNA gyrase subunit A